MRHTLNPGGHTCTLQELALATAGHEPGSHPPSAKLLGNGNVGESSNPVGVDAVLLFLRLTVGPLQLVRGLVE